MSSYIDTAGHIREISDALYAEWVASGNPKAQAWSLAPAKTPAEIAAELDAARIAAIPRSVTMRQARLALLGAGKLSAVDAAIDGMSEPTKSAARIEWEYSGEVQRHNGFVAALGPALGLTSDQIDALFISAAKL